MIFLLRRIFFASAVALLSLAATHSQKPVPMSPITQPVMFDTPEAGRILAALQVFPLDNPWNQEISALLTTAATGACLLRQIGG